MKWGSTLNLLLGVWLVCSPWAIGVSGALATNAILFGIIGFFVAWWSLIAAPENHTPAMINMAIGVWLFISPWVLAYTGGVALWNMLVAGVLMVVFALVRTASAGYARPTHA